MEMLFAWRITVLLLLLLAAVTEAQSGDGDTDTEPTISCTSDITMERSNLTCKLLEGRKGIEDDEDDEGCAVQNMTLCYYDYSWPGLRCLETTGDTFSSKHMTLTMDFNLTVHFKGGGHISRKVNLMKIVKPRSPEMLNITIDANQAVIQIRNPYKSDYLTLDNQVFQLHIFTTEIIMTVAPVTHIGSSQVNDVTIKRPSPIPIQNITSKHFITVDMQHLQGNTDYYVKVRAIPDGKTFKGTWSEWSKTASFRTPKKVKVPPIMAEEQVALFKVIVGLVSVLIVTLGAIIFWKNKIFTYMWPNIPHPKQTLVHICKPNHNLLLNFRPEEFSALKVYPLETTSREEQEHPDDSGSPHSSEPCSTQSSDCRSATSASTEELELSALLSGTSSDSEDSLQGTSSSPVNFIQLEERPATPQLGGNMPEVFGVNQQEEAYVTMSSFYQIK
ncbi:interleukin-7 receptor subunit alpha [Pholidichthys leucotaenia]